MMLFLPLLKSGEKYQGTDALIDNLVKDFGGRGAGNPIINTDQGDLLLFLFAVGGFIAGIIITKAWQHLFNNSHTGDPVKSEK